MSAMQICLSEQASAVARERAAAGGFPSVDAYVTTLIDADAATPVSIEIEAELLKGLEGDGVELSAIDWQQKRQALAARHARAGQP